MEASFITSAMRESQYPPSDKPEVAFAGRSNVGKSSLLNVLVNRKGLARTSSTPGRTQSINFFSVDEGVYFVDLPGYGYARVSRETQRSWGRMVETYLRKRPNLKAVVVILDIRRDPSQGDLDLLEWLRSYGRRPILVLTKVDKLSRGRSRQRASEIGSLLNSVGAFRPVLFSAKTREGREGIWARIREAAGGAFP
ncbi:MAG: ribosome biogenesis GTP-binding protein YihA/YsxC [Thermodesulfobacteriota bacterium]